MKTKKTDIGGIRQRIKTMVKEEITVAINEQVHPLFRKIGHKSKFRPWIMRQYFDPQKHGNKPWFDSTVNVDNVLEYITKASEENNFPTSPNDLVELWKIKKHMDSAIPMMDREEKKAATAARKAKADADSGKVKYQTGDVKLADLADELGVTKTTINNITNSAFDKFSKMTFGKRIDDLETAESKMLFDLINDTREEVADVFASELKYTSTISNFMESLAKQHILTPLSLKNISSSELEALEHLKEKDEDRIALILLQDIEEDDNIFKSFQAAVSRKIVPPGKRGRRAKES